MSSSNGWAGSRRSSSIWSSPGWTSSWEGEAAFVRVARAFGEIVADVAPPVAGAPSVGLPPPPDRRRQGRRVADLPDLARLRALRATASPSLSPPASSALRPGGSLASMACRSSRARAAMTALAFSSAACRRNSDVLLPSRRAALRARSRSALVVR
jgi:hypothetical protein